MKYGILADIHGNLEALNACLAYLEGRVSSYIVLGDIVGYGPHPEECVKIIRELEVSSGSGEGTVVVSGNHDLAAAGLKDTSRFNPDARKAVLWTGKKLSPDAAGYLRNLKPRVDTPGFTAVHGSPRDPVDEYLLEGAAMEQNLSCFEAKVCFVGHSHKPLCYDKEMRLLMDGEGVSHGARGKVIVNPGSVGQPRDRNPMASFAIYDEKQEKISIKRLEYDICKTQGAMLKEGLPASLIERLAFGV